MCTKNLALLFAPSLFQTDGKGEHEVKIMEDLIDHYLHVFDVSSTTTISTIFDLCHLHHHHRCDEHQSLSEHEVM